MIRFDHACKVSAVIPLVIFFFLFLFRLRLAFPNVEEAAILSRSGSLKMHDRFCATNETAITG